MLPSLIAHLQVHLPTLRIYRFFGKGYVLSFPLSGQQSFVPLSCVATSPRSVNIKLRTPAVKHSNNAIIWPMAIAYKSKING